jgi:hypothetical protein
MLPCGGKAESMKSIHFTRLDIFIQNDSEIDQELFRQEMGLVLKCQSCMAISHIRKSADSQMSYRALGWVCS